MSSETAGEMVNTKPPTPQMDMNMYATRKTIAQGEIIVGIVFILLGRLNINFFVDRKKADLLNNGSVILIFLITVVNVLITAFGPSDSSGPGAGGHHQPMAWTNFYPGKLPDDSSR
ncbi:unnamed protein product [Oppiella nova]|uniref:Uncharacterized protein n=1 Tax=Oppiella nova TaxID=334625 RepID=A0A7R9QSY8_9ACAR|nr:unnamed protein product [Oppiella nova]CAG2174319.1 unnamed protein product [Oppiella nova]